MANEITYYQTPFTFINPVRHFKANDPYYYEVDNIPIKQLEESQNFLKDQVDGIIARQNSNNLEIDRTGFSELKPYAAGNDRKVRVKPGKYTARINNAYNLTPLQVVEQIAGYSNTTNSGDRTVSDLNTWRVDTNIGTSVQGVLDEFQQGLQGDALNMNGLAERAFVFPFDDEDGISHPNNPELLNVSAPGYSQFDSVLGPDDRPLYPNYIGAILKHNTPDTTRDLTLIKNVYTTGEKPFGGQQGRIESEFIKRWRGAIRTSIVDVPEELEITVPDFDSDDFFIIDANGNQQPLNANQRIDLLFIYSKAVDEEETTIPQFANGSNPTTLTSPRLGILKGAGIGVSRTTSNNNDFADDRVSLQTLDGTPIMLAHPGDENGTNNGFTTSAGVIRGSFPSPDDLMNLAPALSENLETNAFPLIGQSILPVAYIRVQSGGGPIADIINDEDIIDIRPFFRTTELAYNERAGIAAATPQVSIANPVVTEAHLEKVRKEVYSELHNRIVTLGASAAAAAAAPAATPAAANTGGTGARCIAAGQVLGGYWGPEGALIKHAKSNTAGGIRTATMNQFVDLIESEFGYPAGSIPYLPDWDKARWYERGEFTGDGICDSINIGAPGFVEFGGPQGDAKYMPPWIGGQTNGTTVSVEDIRATYGFDRFSMYQWGPNTGAGFRRSGGGLVQAPGQTGYQNLGTGVGNLGGDVDGKVNSINARNLQINYVTKTIRLNLDDTPWVADYQVKVDLLHCLPLCDARGGNSNPRNSCSVWVQKFKDYFVICVAWAGTNMRMVESDGTFMPWKARNIPERFVGFAQPQMVQLGGSEFGTPGPSPVGYSVNIQPNQYNALFNARTPADTDADYFNPVVPLLYPSVKWEVVGVAQDFVDNALGTNGTRMRENRPVVRCR